MLVSSSIDRGFEPLSGQSKDYANMTDFPVVKVHVDELSSARIWQHTLFATLSANVNINYRLPIKVYYRICTVRHIRIEIIHGSQNVFLRRESQPY
jgi:hypothetical protein